MFYNLDGEIGSIGGLNITGTFDQNCTATKYVFSATQKTIKDGKVDTRTVTINFTDTLVGSEYSLINATTPIVVNFDNELKTISVDVVDANGVGVAGIDVQITAVQGIQFGSIISASTVQSDISGHATFTYKAPQNVANVDGSTTTVKLSMVSNGVTVEANVLIDFVKVNVDIPVPIVVIANQYQEINLTQNSQVMQMEIQVFDQGSNAPYTQGNVKASLPPEVLTGIDVGSFTEYIVPVGANGKAVFNYTGPQDLQTLINNGNLNATFEFFHEDNPTQKENIKVVYDLQGSYIPANYVLTTSSSDGNYTMGLQTLKTFTLYLKDDQGTLIDDADITQILIESKNTVIGQLVNNAGVNVPLLTLNGPDAINSKSFPIQTYTLSGLLPIEMTVTFTDANGVSKTLTINMNIVVFSGPPTAMSISYAGVEQNSTVAKYIEKFALTVTDTYNNPVNTRPYVAVGAMIEYAVDGSSGTGIRHVTSPRLWHGLDDPRGELEAIGGNKAQFTTTVDTFNYVDIFNDKLVVFGAGFVYEALGKWDIDSIANTVLQLKDDYTGTTRSNLFFAVGHNNRQDLCSAGNEFVGNMKASNYQLDANGNALIEFEYDYHLTGKDMMIWANLTGFQADNGNIGRIGEAKKHTLRGNGLMSRESYLVKAGSSGVELHFNVHHENAPEWYRNGHFGFAYQGCKVDDIIDHSNLHDARVCSNGAVAYVDLNVSNPSTEDCTISLVNIAVSNELNGVTYP